MYFSTFYLILVTIAFLFLNIGILTSEDNEIVIVLKKAIEEII